MNTKPSFHILKWTDWSAPRDIIVTPGLGQLLTQTAVQSQEAVSTLQNGKWTLLFQNQIISSISWN